MVMPQTSSYKTRAGAALELRKRAKLSSFINPDPAEWIRDNFYIPETKSTLQLQPYQSEALNRALHRTDGLFDNSIVIWSDVKKSAKSTLAAAVALWWAFQVEWGQIVIVANDLKQADSRVGFYLRRAIELNPAMASVCKVIQYKVTLPNRTIIEAVPIDPTGEAGGNADGVFFCLDEQTEVLTKDGWKGWETLSTLDMVATRSKDGCFEWQQPNSIYCNHYSGEMIGVNHRSFDFLVTPNHRMYGKFIGGRGVASGVSGCQRGSFVDALENRFVEAKDAANCQGYYPVVTSEWNGGNENEFIIRKTINQAERVISADLFAEFMGWYLSEGCVIKKRGKIEGFAIGQSTKNGEKRERIIQLIKEIGFTPHLWKGGINIVVYHSEFGKWLSQFGLSGDKFIPDEIKNLNKRCLEIFIKAYSGGDGTILWNGSVVISSKSRTMIDDMAEISQKCGYWITEYSQTDYRWKNNPVVYSIILKKLSTKRQKIEKDYWQKVQYDGMVFCPSTDNGIIYIRRNGRYIWTGNSELWGAHAEAQRRMWVEQTLPPNKFGRSFRWVETYAGYSGESLLLEQLYEQATKHGHRLKGDVPMYRNAPARMFALWNDRGRMPWHTQEYYAQEHAVLLPNEFARIHENKWVSSEDIFVPLEWWDACKGDKPDEHRNEGWVIALDAGVSNDTFAVVGMTRHPDDTDRSIVRYSRRWKPPKNGKIELMGTEDNPGPEMELERLFKSHNIIQVAYDPFQLEFFASRMSSKHSVWFRAFSQAKERLVADNTLRKMIQEKRIVHGGEPDLREHIGNANAEIDPEERKIRIVKRSELLKIDLAVALSMANCEIMRLNL